LKRLLTCNFVRQRLLFLFIAILVIKAIFLAIDPYPAFMLGDSASYLTTALIRWIPPDRSFVYGFILRKLIINSHSLLPVVWVQVALSALTAWLVGFCLVRYFKCRFWIAAVCALLCAAEPLQLMFERFILSDSLAASLFALFCLTVFSYMRRENYLVLAAMQFLSTFLVSLRLSFLPFAILSSFLVPLVSSRAIEFYKSFRTSQFGGTTSRAKLVTPVLVGLIISIGLSQYFLLRYRVWYGDLIHKAPAYSYQAGSFLLAVAVPLVHPDDFAMPEVRDEVFKKLKHPLADPSLRAVHHWMKGGMNESIKEVIGNDDISNRVMQVTALNAIKRNPLGLVKLSGSTLSQFLKPRDLRATLLVEEGQDNPASSDLVALIWHDFAFDLSNRHFDSLAKLWHSWAIPWYWFLLASPLIYPLALFLTRQPIGPPHLMCELFALLIVLATIVPVERAVTRYLITEGWLAFIMIGSLFSSPSILTTAMPEAEHAASKAQSIK
jgi:hypothetical protein